MKKLVKTVPQTATLEFTRYPDGQTWRRALACQINENAVEQLLRDAQDKRRKLYLEFHLTCPQQLLRTLDMAGFDMTTVKRVQTTGPVEATSDSGVSCLVTGTAHTIRRFLLNNAMVHRVSVDLPEYSWLSSC